MLHVCDSFHGRADFLPNVAHSEGFCSGELEGLGPAPPGQKITCRFHRQGVVRHRPSVRSGRLFGGAEVHFIGHKLLPYFCGMDYDTVADFEVFHFRDCPVFLYFVSGMV